MKKGDNVHLYQCQSTGAPGFITDIKQRKQKYTYICIFFLLQTVWEILILLVAQNDPSSVRLGTSHARRYIAKGQRLANGKGQGRSRGSGK